jgi:hypothetical protein
MPDPRDTQRRSDSDPRLAEPPTQPLQEGFDAFGPLLTNAQAWTQQVTTLNASIQREWLNFVDKRFKEDAALGQSLVACKAPDDIMRACTSFYRTPAQRGMSGTTEAIETGRSHGPLMEAQMSAASGTPAPHASARRHDASNPATSH